MLKLLNSEFLQANLGVASWRVLIVFSLLIPTKIVLLKISICTVIVLLVLVISAKFNMGYISIS